MNIKTKLIVFFILAKVIPVLIIFLSVLFASYKLKSYIIDDISSTSKENSLVLDNTTKEAMKDTVKYLDKKSQESIEKMTFQLANEIADFLYQRDVDILLLSNMDINQNNLKIFFDKKTKKTKEEGSYTYNKKESKWISKNEIKNNTQINELEILDDNKKEFNHVFISSYKFKDTRIYKEINFFDLHGNEIYKISTLNSSRMNIFKKENTYLKAENIKINIENLQKGEIFVSDVVGEYIPSKIIGSFTEENAKKAKIPFEPTKHAYAGIENPKGKKFEGIVRFITPVFKDNKKSGYVSLALDHKHIMDFTDNFNPVDKNIINDISDASSGNYAFMWDYEGRNISHPRDYFIAGFDKNTGERVKPWLSKDLSDKFEKSGKNINEFLEQYPKFYNQSSKKKPNIKQLKNEGNIALDCRYLNFAPQCHGWMELTKNGGYGSFMILWSGVLKLTTAAAIPYYTSQYSKTKRGFGFVTIGANVEEFHAAANQTKNKIDTIIEKQKNLILEKSKQNEIVVEDYIKSILTELIVLTVIMVSILLFLAFWLSNYITKKLDGLIKATEQISTANFDYEIEVNSNDELGKLQNAFNLMSKKIKSLLQDQENNNKLLSIKVKEEVEKTKQKELNLLEKSKLAAMGEMIGNIAHQWRQPLNVISTSASSIEFSLAYNLLNEDEIEKFTKRILQQTDYLSETINTFSSFIKKDNKESYISTQELFDYVSSLTSASLKNNFIYFEIDIKDNESIRVNKNEISEAFLNIINNAKDSILSKDDQLEERIILIKVKKIDNKLQIEFYDNGSGIKESIKNRIFEPYFTTKHKSVGTGIGLDIVRKIIEEKYEGSVSIDNVKFLYNKKTHYGACFKVLLNLE